MSRVWEKSEHKGSALLLLLALADNADDSGYCWPGVDYLAHKIRMTPQSVINITRKLEESGELYADHNRRAGNRYLVATGMNEQEIRKGMLKFDYGDDHESRTKKFLIKAGFSSELKSFDNRTKIAALKESSLTVNESSSAENDDCPFPRKYPDAQIEPAYTASDLTTEEGRQKAQEARIKQMQASSEKPWLYWHDNLRPRNGVPKSELQRVGWLITQNTGLEPATGRSLKSWTPALEEIYATAKGDFGTIESGIRRVWSREPKYRPAHPSGFVGEVAKTAAGAYNAGHGTIVGLGSAAGRVVGL